MRSIICWLGWCGMETKSDDTGIWGQCPRCGRKAGFVSREALQRYARAEQIRRDFEEEQARRLASK